MEHQLGSKRNYYINSRIRALLVALSDFGVIACIFRSVRSHFMGANPGFFCKTPLDAARFLGIWRENVKNVRKMIDEFCKSASFAFAAVKCPARERLSS